MNLELERKTVRKRTEPNSAQHSEDSRISYRDVVTVAMGEETTEAEKCDESEVTNHATLTRRYG